MISSTILLIKAYNKKQYNSVQQYTDKIISIETLSKLDKEISLINNNQTNNQKLALKNKIYKTLSTLNKKYILILQLNFIINRLKDYNNDVNNQITGNNITMLIQKLLEID